MMVKKTKNKAFEFLSDLPAELRKEVLAFQKRNLIEDGEHCPNCLKGHALKKAGEIGLSEEIINSLESSLPGNAGHHGYYLDKKALIRI